MKKTLTVLLIEDSPDYAELVQQWLSIRSDMAFVLNWTDSLLAGLNRLEQGGVDVILLDLGLPDSSGLGTFTRTKLKASGVPIILLSADDCDPLALQMVQEGAQDYIAKGSCNGDLLVRAIQYAVVRYSSQGRKTGAEPLLEQATFIGVLGAKGGVGGTTLACNLAVELRRQTGQKTLLADLDVSGGMVSFLMSADSQHSILDAAGNVHRLDLSFWEGMVAHGPDDLHIVRSPGLLGLDEPNTDNLRHVLAMVRKFYRWMVVDFGRLSGFSMPMLDKVTELFLVTTTSVPALYEAKRTIGALRKAGFEADRLRLIVNQLAKTQDFSGSELDRIFGVPVYAKFSGAGRELHDACVQGRLPAENSDFRIQMAGLARKVAGLPMEKPRSRVSQLFSFSEKSPTVDSHVSGVGGV